MRPNNATGAHQTGYLAELVCSNSLGSRIQNRASGLLNAELERLNCLLIEVAKASAVPAGNALAVDRTEFARRVTERIEAHPRIRLIRQEMTEIPQTPCIVASGPLTSPALASSIAAFCGRQSLWFYDAISPIVLRESIDMNIAFQASRRENTPEGDYINCPLERGTYYAFVDALAGAARIDLRSIEAEIPQGVDAGRFFEGCLPVEILAQRGKDALAFGPMRPVGLRDPKTGSRPYAVVQLRQDNLAATLYNLVGFQTNLRQGEQQRVFRMIPGLETAEFVRYGQMHRNTFIASPLVLLPSLQTRERPDLFFAGQIMGVEGYLGNIATGWLAGTNAARFFGGEEPLTLPRTTMLGALCHYATHADLRDFQPMKANYGLLPQLELPRRAGKLERAQSYTDRALASLDSYIRQVPAWAVA
jgi:methylenetetrahydrofolate--tRNA-(uracil-5-)-methyltransferase